MYSRMVWRFMYGVRAKLTSQEWVMFIMTEVMVREDDYKEVMMMEEISCRILLFPRVKLDSNG